ncbi:MAG TPA: PilZ domain-containing protein [Usitatibacteraceae bacterium]
MSSLPPNSGNTAPTRWPDVISLNLKGKSALYAAWIPLLKGGGLFMQTVKPHQLGDEVLLVLSFLEDQIKIPLTGKVAWINPPHAHGNRPQGVAIQLPDNEVGRELKKKIEGILAPVVKSDRVTHTL